MPTNLLQNIDAARRNMVMQQIRANGVLDETILHCLQHTPREWFVPEGYRDFAFADMTVPLGYGQVMFRPQEEGRFLQALSLKPHHRVLEIGTGSGYFTALLAKQVAHVETVDCMPDFIQRARQALEHCGLQNITFQTKNIFHAHKMAEDAYDVVMIGGGIPLITEFMYAWVAQGGTLLAVVGRAPVMRVVRWRRQGKKGHREILFETCMPLLMDATHHESFVF